jgi:RNA polymerase sigma-70 factor (ECF subfamily)
VTQDLPAPDTHTQDLLVQARAGDQAAWEQLFQRYRTLLTVTAHVRIPSLFRHRFATDDVIQDAFLSAWQDLEGFEYTGEGSFRRWLARIVMNTLHDHVRHNTAKGRDARRERGDAHLEQGDRVESPDELLARLERHRAVLLAMAALPEEEQDLICQRIFEDLSFYQIAANLGWAVTTVRRRYADAVERLARKA